jgi:hypothetical protein
MTIIRYLNLNALGVYFLLTKIRLFVTTLLKEVTNMATNGARGNGRHGAIRNRSQSFNPQTGLWTKRGPNGQFMDTKTSGGAFKGVRREK